MPGVNRCIGQPVAPNVLKVLEPGKARGVLVGKLQPAFRQPNVAVSAMGRLGQAEVVVCNFKRISNEGRPPRSLFAVRPVPPGLLTLPFLLSLGASFIRLAGRLGGLCGCDEYELMASKVGTYR